MIPFIQNVQNRQIHKNKSGLKEDCYLPKSGQAERNMKYGVSFGRDENALKLDSDHRYTTL